MRDPAGRLRIEIGRDRGAVRVRLRSSWPHHVARRLIGRDADAAAQLLPMLYRLCSTAQAAACAQAVEEAGKSVAPVPIDRLRARLIAGETIREHLWRLLLDWPGVLGEPGDEAGMAQVMALSASWRQALMAGGDPLCPHATISAANPDELAVEQVRQAMSGLIAARVFGSPPGAWLAEVCDLGSLAAWSERSTTVAARLIGQLVATDRAALGRCRTPALPRLDRQVLAACLAGREDWLAAEPTWSGRPHETSALTRNLDWPLIVDLARRFGNGLLSRLTAQLVEVARLSCAGAAERHDLAGEATGLGPKLDTGVGLSMVHAARGLLVHRVALDGRQVVDYAILAPTAWNFHPQGVVVEGLAALCQEVGAVDAALVRLFVVAVDPCVEFELASLDADSNHHRFE
jgi:hypothetical protein